MIRHIIKLIWNRKRSLAWIFAEQTLVFGVLLLVFTSQVDRFTRFHSKGTINMNNIAVIGLLELDKPQQRAEEETMTQFLSMVERIKEWPSVELVSINRSGGSPGMGNSRRDSISFNGRRFSVNLRFCDENFFRMFSPKLTEGQWFRYSEAFDEIAPAIVTQLLADRIGLTGSAIGQNIYFDGRTYRITGVVEAFKDRASYEQLATMFVPASIDVDRGWEVVVKYKSGQGDVFAKAFMAEFYKNFSGDRFQPFMMDFTKAMVQMNFMEYSFHIYILLIPAMFLLIFAFMGTFGLVWVQSKRRMSEFGLRMAMGCTPARLIRSIIFENLILTAFAMLPGLIVMVNLYAFAPKGWEWIAAVCAAIVIMFLFAAVSAWYPAWKAAKVQPVEALKGIMS